MATAIQLSDSLYKMSPAEVVSVFDAAARKLLGISGDEFIERWKNGYWEDPDSESWVMEVASLMPTL